MKLIPTPPLSERTVAPLVDAATAKPWRKAARVLFVNGSVLSPSQDIQGLVLARTVADAAGVGDLTELLGVRAKATFDRLMQRMAPGMMPSLLEGALDFHEDKAKIEKALKKKISHDVAQVASAVTADRSELEAVMRPFFLSLGLESTHAAKTFALGWVRKMIEQQERMVGPDHRDMVAQLLSLGLARPWMRVSACPSCLAQELVFADFSHALSACGRCGQPWFSGEMLLVDDEFAALKKADKDLSVFIAAYLRQKVFGAAEIHPEAKAEPREKNIQIDVALPQILVGIECKTIPECLVITNQKARSIAGDLIRQAGLYAEAGVREFLAVTNLTPDGADAVDEIVRKMKHPPGPFPQVLKVLPGDFDLLLKALDAYAERLQKASGEDLDKEIEGRIATRVARKKADRQARRAKAKSGKTE